eukprot:15446048-Alexandrium_andersonii.AAC.1
MSSSLWPCTTTSPDRAVYRNTQPDSAVSGRPDSDVTNARLIPDTPPPKRLRRKSAGGTSEEAGRR